MKIRQNSLNFFLKCYSFIQRFICPNLMPTDSLTLECKSLRFGPILTIIIFYSLIFLFSHLFFALKNLLVNNKILHKEMRLNTYKRTIFSSINLYLTKSNWSK